MAVSGHFGAFPTLSSYPTHHLRRSSLSSKVGFAALNGEANTLNITSRWPSLVLNGHPMHWHSRRILGPRMSISQEAESFLLNAINMNFLERLNLAWKIMFPPQETRSSNARIAKQRLKMILFSDRCAVSDEAKQKIVNNIVHALSDFVEIESQDKVQLSVSTDPNLGTVYSVTVPIRRVKPEYQAVDETGTIANIRVQR